MGCGQTLFLGAGGYVTCGWEKCPHPDAVSAILDDAETDHIVELTDSSWSVRHPLRERIDDAMLDCPLGRWLADLSGPPHKPGRYVARLSEDRWEFFERRVMGHE